ncbi:TonB-dependent receptor [Sphingomonas sp. LB-2]|uniref:TonB-dependent receptor domain-containing protein n=1 Tax=Sphingomonas caeni TaxID=2984949 RepID=UPI00222FE26B|nr:TonB-dependent receptor [Sphingomonas caeni]MCW3849521.1 TonB-dependent receptor [Sphingomonas caeni]
MAQTTPPAQADDQSNDEITVTGSRVITNNLNSPTPITTVDVGQLAKTTPSDIADGLNKLPQIIGGRTPRTQGNGGTNNGGNVLSLRNFGPSRTLVLLDGHRVPSSNQDGTVNIDILPQMLVKRVDIVTGGASAVYGSDAVAGVVNFVLDKEFTGLSIRADAGISNYGDGEEWQFGGAWGTDLFDGRGHFEASGRYRKQALIPLDARPYAADGQAWLLAGNGSPGNPFVNVPYSRVFNSGQFGNVQCGSACGFNNYTFNTAGVLSPMIHGIPTGTANLESGGDGSYNKNGTFRSEIEMYDAFARLDYDVTDDVNVYVQATYGRAFNKSNWISWVVSPSANRPNTLFANNPFLAPATQVQLGANIVCGTPAAAGWRCLPAMPATSPQTNTTPPVPPTTPYFSAPSYIWQKIGGEDVRDTNRLYRTESDQQNINVEVGLTGSLGKLRWDLFYSHGESRLTVTNPNNTDNAKYLASLDAVIAPPGTTVNGRDVSGTIVCWVLTQPQYAGLYPGCVPTNITDPNGPSLGAYNYLRTPTSWTLTQRLDNIGGSIGGDIGFGLPAGNIRANVSFDLRWATYKMESAFRPTDFVDCTGLRMCLANGGAPVRWVQNTNNPVDANNNVYEVAGEVNIPLVKDFALAQELSVNLAGRYTKYSTFSAVKSWKAGVDWHVNPSIAFRGTASLDIRAPNLNDLYQPSGVSSTGFLDLLTNGNNSLRLITRGNPNLTPEKARTITLGVVLTPEFLPNFGVSFDYYRTRMTDAITQISYQSTAIQNICLASAPNYDSPFCSLAVRPITNPADPNYKNPNFNFPTEIRNSPLNAARQETEGFEIQVDYRFDTAQLISWLPGSMSMRHMLAYQPVNTTVNIPGAFPTWAVQPKLRQTTFVSYQNEAWGLSLQNQWLGSVRMATSDNALNGNSQNYVIPKLKPFNLLDATVNVRMHLLGGDGEAFLTVNNVLNARAPLYPSNSGIPNLFYPTLGFHDDMGRFFTFGVRAKF